MTLPVSHERPIYLAIPMSPIEKAEQALNAQIEQVQARLKAASLTQPRPDLVQGVLVWAGLGETITQYVASIGEYARKRHGELKQIQLSLTVQHDELLKSGNEMLVRLKDDPSDRVVQKAIGEAQRAMETIQKTLRRGAATLQKEVNPCIRSIDTVAENIYRLCESKDRDRMKRWTKAIVREPEELYRAHPALPAKAMIDTASWERSAAIAIDEAPTFFEAQARAAFQAMIALEIMILGISMEPPRSPGEATERANAGVSLRLKKIMQRLADAGEAPRAGESSPR